MATIDPQEGLIRAETLGTDIKVWVEEAGKALSRYSVNSEEFTKELEHWLSRAMQKGVTEGKRMSVRGNSADPVSASSSILDGKDSSRNVEYPLMVPEHLRSQT